MNQAAKQVNGIRITKCQYSSVVNDLIAYAAATGDTATRAGAKLLREILAAKKLNKVF